MAGGHITTSRGHDDKVDRERAYASPNFVHCMVQRVIELHALGIEIEAALMLGEEEAVEYLGHDDSADAMLADDEWESQFHASWDASLARRASFVGRLTTLQAV